MPFAACLCCFNFQKFRICLHSNSLQALFKVERQEYGVTSTGGVILVVQYKIQVSLRC